MILRSDPLPLLLRRHKPVIVAILALFAGVAGGLLAQWPLPTLAGLTVLVLSLVLVGWPKTATLVVLFLLYSNLAVVAVRFHGLPLFVGAAFPLLLALPLFSYLAFERQPIRITPALPAVLVFLAIQQASMAFSRDPALSIPAAVNTLAEGFLIYILLINVVRTPGMLRYAAWTLLFAGVVLAIAPMIQQLTGNFDSNFGGLGQLSEASFRTGETGLQGDVRQVRMTGPIGEQNRYSQVMLVLVPLGWFILNGERKLLGRLLAVGLTLVALAGMTLSFSRGAAVAFVLMIVVMFVTRVVQRSHVIAIVMAFAVTFLVFPQYTARLVTIPTVTDLLDEEAALSEQDGAIRGRATVMLAALQVFADYPLLGVGPGQFKYYSAEYGNRIGLRILEGDREAHSLYLGIAADNGIFGLIAFLVACLLPIWIILRLRHKLAGTQPALNNVALGFAFAMVAYLTSGLFLHLSYVRYFWLVLALVDAAAYIAREAAGEQREPAGLPLRFFRRRQQEAEPAGEAG